MTMISFLTVVVIVALSAAFIVLLAKKVGITEWMQVHGDKVLSQMASCDFCLSFWAGTLLFMVLACVYDDPLLMFGGMVSCPLTRMLVA